MKASRRFRSGLLALALVWASSTTVMAQSTGQSSSPSAGQPTTAPSYEDLASLARAAGVAPPSPLAYRLVLHFSPASVSANPAEAFRLAREADLGLRFGTSPQEVGMRIRLRAAIATQSGPMAEGMTRLLREQALRAGYPGSGFGGPERGAGRLGPGLGRLSWSSGSDTTNVAGPGSGAQPLGGGGSGGGGSGPGKRGSPQ